MWSPLQALTPPIESVGTIRWCTGLRHLPLGELDLTSEPERLAEIRSHSPFLLSHIGEHLLMPALWEALDYEDLIDLRRGRHAHLEMSGPAWPPAVEIRAPGQAPEWLEPRYLIAAGGASSTVRDALGITMSGPVLANLGSAFFHAPDLFPSGANRPLLSWICHPDFNGVLIAHADDDYVLMTPYLHASQLIARDSDTYWNRPLPRVLGATTFGIRLTGTWTMTSQLADEFRLGATLLIGDAAHRSPRTGGFGLNSGVHDAHNFAWRLAAVLAGCASDALLDTCDIE